MTIDPIAGGEHTPFIVIFTDLDGTLLDHLTYQGDMAKPALDMCKQLQVPIVMVSSKTRAEMDILRDKIGILSPFISENGGGIFFPKEIYKQAPSGTIIAQKIFKWEMGAPYKILIKALREIQDELNLPIKGFSEMTVEEISHLTGLDLDASRLAAKRDYDEPFILLKRQNMDKESLHREAKKRDLQITEGGRFFHIHGKNDKGMAVKKLISWYEQSHPHVFSIALGDSPNDVSMLKQVDYPVLISSSQAYPSIAEDLPNLKVTQEEGPKGWNIAVLEILNEKLGGGISNNV